MNGALLNPRRGHEYVAGTVLASNYRLLHPLGKGGMGSVWAAHSELLDITVAVKLIRMDTANEDTPQRVIQEARATARLADPGIVRMFEVGKTEHGDPFIVMELLVGTTLRQTMDTGPLGPVRAVRLLLPIVRALDSARRAGVVHRDIKPENIVLALGARGELQPKLVDFGVAKVLTSDNQLTRVGVAVGSPLYMSPEQARGEPVDHRTDLWSLCAVLYEALVGKPPFQADNQNALLHAIITKEALPLSEHKVGDAELCSIVQRGLTKNVEERWQRARDLMLALAAWLRRHGATEDVTGLSLSEQGVGPASGTPIRTTGAPARVQGQAPTGVFDLGESQLGIPPVGQITAPAKSAKAVPLAVKAKPAKAQPTPRARKKLALQAAAAAAFLALAAGAGAWLAQPRAAAENSATQPVPAAPSNRPQTIAAPNAANSVEETAPALEPLPRSSSPRSATSAARNTPAPAPSSRSTAATARGTRTPAAKKALSPSAPTPAAPGGGTKAPAPFKNPFD